MFPQTYLYQLRMLVFRGILFVKSVVHTLHAEVCAVVCVVVVLFIQLCLYIPSIYVRNITK